MPKTEKPHALWRDVLNLAAPQTWAGSMAPATVALDELSPNAYTAALRLPVRLFTL